MAENEIAQAVRAALQSVTVPAGGDLASYPGLSEIIVTPSAVALAISIAPGSEAAWGAVRTGAEIAASKAAQGRKVMVSLTAGKAAPAAAQAAPEQNKGIGPKEPVPGIRHIIAVGSGKGGVGKSTCAVNLALALKAEGLRVGVLDTDLYGPSIPRLLGLGGRPTVTEDDKLAPMQAHGLKTMSIGSMLEADQAVIWRGPLISSGLRQLLRDTAWGELDVLLLDLPPGTGDIQLSLGQQVVLTGALIVSTPQDLALIDARRAMDMFRRLEVPLLGLIENMSYFVAPDTGARYDIFGHGGARAAAAELKIPFLGEVPIHMAIRETSDTGRPVMATDPGGVEAAAFRDVARALLASRPDLKA